MENEITTIGKMTFIENGNEQQTMVFEVGQLFDCKPIVGQRTLKIIAIAEKYIFVRFKGCTPFAKSEKEFGRYLESLNAVLKTK